MHATDRNTKRYLARKHFRFVTAFSIGFVLIHNECGREDIAIRQKRQAGKKDCDCLSDGWESYALTRVLRVQGVRRAPRDVNPIYKWLHGLRSVRV